MPDPARIILIEDTAELRQDLALELRDAGYTVIEACDGRTAMALFGEERPDLVLCDIQLPDIDGIEVLKAIRSNESGTDALPAIVVSAFSDQELRRQAASLGISRFMVKPIDYEELLVAISETLDENSAEALR